MKSSLKALLNKPEIVDGHPKLEDVAIAPAVHELHEVEDEGVVVKDVRDLQVLAARQHVDLVEMR